VVVLAARAPKRLTLDPGGFFVILPDARRGVIVCEHYRNDGRLIHAVEGTDAALLAATVIEEGWMTQLDHAAYLGRELQKAHFVLEHGLRYVQDGALGQVEDLSAGCSAEMRGDGGEAMDGSCRGGATCGADCGPHGEDKAGA
jgi:tetrahydromethanopterin S-methyltransferase subunit A